MKVRLKLRPLFFSPPAGHPSSDAIRSHVSPPPDLFFLPLRIRPHAAVLPSPLATRRPPSVLTCSPPLLSPSTNPVASVLTSPPRRQHPLFSPRDARVGPIPAVHFPISHREFAIPTPHVAVASTITGVGTAVSFVQYGENTMLFILLLLH
jgi:hypothetical protein